MLGPTAVGKTAVSLSVGHEDFEIVSADSVQVYRYFDIGSGKPSREELDSVRHHLISVVNPDRQFTAGDFCREALDACNKITAGGKLPMFVGGTGLYIDSFFKGLSEIPPVDSSIRNILLEELGIRGLGGLHEELMDVDPVFGSRVHRNDRQRVLRGLEVFRGTGRPISSYYGSLESHGSDLTLYMGLFDDMESVRKRIDLRVDEMLKRGFVDEVVSIRKMGYGPELKSMQSIGYLEINGLLDGAYGLDEAVARIKAETKKYAKRQMTRFKKNEGVIWCRPEETGRIRDLIGDWFTGSKPLKNKKISRGK
ncbi:MAG: tRNA (adenosine(37)-N6)-dimethylallyltransferase MiaA [Spirochaetes bacterium]|nr:tRNA (adenosine(37)-N6)-dimethylallyltransferase MiaA [Spirochaetota bacterium]